MKESIPHATALRLPLYQRYLRFLQDTGRKRISSAELSEGVKVDSATIRRDFSYFGELGKRGYGYDVDYLCDFFSKILNQDRLTTVGLVGVGNLGSALLNYNFRKNHNIRIGCAFDINQDMVGTIRSGVPVYGIDQISEIIHDLLIEVVILTVPRESAQDITDKLVDAGVKGIMNFTPIRLDVPDSVVVQNVDLTTELQTLIYFIDNKNHKK